MKNFIGIDPGLDGSVAIIWAQDCEYTRHDGREVEFCDTPTLLVGTKRQYHGGAMVEILKKCDARDTVVALESVHSMPKQGVASSFTFGLGLGMWQGIISALGIPVQMVTPQRWKKAMMDGMAKEKDASRQRAMQLFPNAIPWLDLKKHHNRADALLLAEYLRRTNELSSRITKSLTGE